MRDWCKHSFGYVNFDDEFMYFTSTGNWSDVLDLGEFNEKTNRRSSSSEKYKTMSYMGVAGVLLVVVLWVMGIGSLSISGIIGIALLAYSAYHYMAPGLTGEFKIPYSEISNIELIDSTIKITFLDVNHEEKIQEVSSLNEKGVNLFLSVSIPV
ncbi:MAG: hypothetical protein AB8B56_01370 [Crocinitomicaceae bacterium]